MTVRRWRGGLRCSAEYSHNARPRYQGDAAYVEPIEDSVLLTVRPRWYTLTVWSTVLGRDWIVMRSNQLDELERTASQFNAAIHKVLTHAA